MVVDKLQPVATDAVAGTDLEAIIAADITAFKNRANGCFLGNTIYSQVGRLDLILCK